MSKVTIGNLIDDSRSDLRLDLDQLVNSRALIQANSGGGKSWLLRLIAEQASGKVQTIILDPEGEFATLREKCDALLVGCGGEAATRLASAQALAQRLCELRVSAIIDLYDLKLPERRRYVRMFLDALMAMPRSAWHPLFVILDEAQNFAPERAAGEAESLDAVITLMSQGRKRGFSGILATQRLSKLHKDAAAEANNVFIGRTWLDNDQARAGDMLGLDKRRRMELRDLVPGTWFAFGPALERSGVWHFKAGAVRTTHPEAGSRHKLAVPAASAAIKKLLPELEGLADDSPDAIYDIEAAKKRIADLQRQLASRPAAEPTRVEVPAIPTAQADALVRACVAASGGAAGLMREISDAVHGFRKIESAMTPLVSRITEAADGIKNSLARFDGRNGSPPTAIVKRVPSHSTPPRPASTHSAPVGGMTGLDKAGRCIVRALGQHGQLSKRALALIAGYSLNGGGFGNALSRLRSKGIIEGFDYIELTADGAALGPFEPLPHGRALADFWMAGLDKAGREIIAAFLDANGATLTRAELAARTASKYAPEGGGFGNAISRLRTLGLVHGKSDALWLAPELLG